MRVDTQQIKRFLKEFNFLRIFDEGLGWNRPREAPPAVTYKNQQYTFTPVAEKAGFRIYQHTFQGRIPDEQTLKQIDKPLEAYAEEHLTIFVDARQENQAWLWVKKGANQPRVARLNRLNKNQSGELLVQKIARLFVSMDEEESITLTSILDRVNLAFDVEKVTTKFYRQFQEKHAYFLGRIENIPDKDDRKWYTSIMLNRLMFIYFLQRKGLLNNTSSVRLAGELDYLQNRLKEVQEKRVPGNFYEFLCRLFHEGLNLPEGERDPELKQMIGNVPYINGGIFDVHALEKQYPDIRIEDDVFKKLFDFFEEFDWHLDDRPMRSGQEINPDVLGYIFEKYINQKQMGAYYTKEDITGYISKNAIIPFIFEKVAQQYPDAFMKDGPIWSLLRANPDDYIYEEMAHGLLEPLPPEIEAGITDIAQRTTWNRTVGEQWALPTETWREIVERRRRYKEVHRMIVEGKMSTINDLVTYNLNITQFARDVIATCKEPGLLRAFYETIEQVTVLDPTCGSGAFLFAALNTLKPLYQACINCMHELVDEHDRQQAGLRATQRKDGNHILAFREILDRVNQHRNQTYFILKSIIVNNLFGVDIMEEAIEICKLRLFLKLVAQIEKPQELEPLPDIDFNVLVGNTLIGFTSLDEIRQVVTTKLVNIGDTEKTLQLIEQDAQEIERDEQSFRNMQTKQGMEIESTATSDYKLSLREKLARLRGKLDPYLATEYGIDHDNILDEKIYQEKYTQWHKGHKPFHWWAEFYKIMRNGGFDVIIGNPPYVEYRATSTLYKVLAGQYTSESTKNLYAFCMERSSILLHSDGRFGMIVPAGLLGLDEAVDLRRTLLQRLGANWFSTFAIRPSKLFEGVDQRLCIHIASIHHAEVNMYTTIYHHWYVEERPALFALLRYHVSDIYPPLNRIPQVGNREAAGVLAKLRTMQRIPLRYYFASHHSGFLMHYHRSPRYWIRGMDFEQYFKSETRDRSIHHFRDLYFREETEGKTIGAILNSSLFFFWFISIGNGRNITGADVEQFPVGPLSEVICKNLVVLFDTLMDDYKRNSVIRIRRDCEFQEFRPSRSKLIIDEIDRVLAQHYGFTPEELDFIMNYDIKYRVGRDNGEESEE